jgi:hypothetical protein
MIRPSRPVTCAIAFLPDADHSMTRIVTTAHRPKRPPRKRKAVALAGPAIVRKVKAPRRPTAGQQKPEPAVPPPPANDDRKPHPPGARKPAIVTSASRKRTRLLRFEQPAELDDDPEATARVKAFFARMIRPP